MTEAEVQETLSRAEARYKAHVEKVKSSPPSTVKRIPPWERDAFEKAIAFKIVRGTDHPRRKYDICYNR